MPPGGPRQDLAGNLIHCDAHDADFALPLRETLMIEHDRLAAALAMAHAAHQTQKRKGTSIPYISHPMAVAALVLEFGGSEDQAIAALLHDTIEDGGEAYAERIGEAFGPHVLAMVRACTDGTAESKAAAVTMDAKRADWQARKDAYLAHLEAMPSKSPALLVSACDKLHNAHAVLEDFQRVGERVFERFTGGREGTLWYYAEVARLFAEKGVAPAARLSAVVAALQR
ncbi:HD domain-containing protein [Dokdonella sp.]|uniref:HD domain-containing protein n=1 Tax=Dokdonella sp. TaxID=2291710 RepID=UPI0031BC0DD6|nr:HD domain-containing protein [Dokdonella sp.]